jgi:hypothetical protein
MMNESTDHPESNLSDYEWHFKLSETPNDQLHADALTEMVRRQLKAILGCVVLTADGAPVRTTGFRFLADPATEHALHPGLDGGATTETGEQREIGDGAP